MYKIEKGIPIPRTRWGPGCYNKYPFDLLEVGDSFLVETTDKYEKRKKQASIIATSKSRRPQQFATRTVPEGVRVWRIK